MHTFRILGTGLVLMLPGLPVQAFDVTEQFSIGGVVAAALQCQRPSGKVDAHNECDQGLPLQTEFSYRPFDNGEFFVKAGFASDNGLNDTSPFVLAPWAADLHDDVRDINGSGRDYLLTAWYQHTFTLAVGGTLAATVGIIDATDYLDENAYANDEFTQFMNEALVNGPNGFYPSYDAGAALAWSDGPWSLRGVVMRVSENDDGNDFTFYGAQLGYTVQSDLGEGNYRVVVDRTSEEFLDGNSGTRHARTAILLSFDQELGEALGGFLRLGWQDDESAVDYEWIWSGGIDIDGASWNRAADNIGLGYAYLDGGNQDISQSQVAEAYYRFAINRYLALSADVQYMKDSLRHQDDPEGAIYGLRLTAEF